jgi:hypothetical protein
MRGDGRGRLPMIERVCEILKSMGRKLDKRFDIIFLIKAAHNIAFVPLGLKNIAHQHL